MIIFDNKQIVIASPLNRIVVEARSWAMTVEIAVLLLVVPTTWGVSGIV
jgi:hypothetical protein